MNEAEQRQGQPPEEEQAQDQSDHSLNEFLADVSLAARDLTANIRSSVNKVLEQSVRVVNPSGDGPQLDMYETAESVIIETTPLESADPDSIEITMLGDQLSIRLQTKDERDIEERAFLLREKRFGDYTRSLKIPRAIQMEEARARIKDGKLYITLPKPRRTERKRIRIIAED